VDLFAFYIHYGSLITQVYESVFLSVWNICDFARLCSGYYIS